MNDEEFCCCQAMGSECMEVARAACDVYARAQVSARNVLARTAFCSVMQHHDAGGGSAPFSVVHICDTSLSMCTCIWPLSYVPKEYLILHNTLMLPN